MHWTSYTCVHYELRFPIVNNMGVSTIVHTFLEANLLKIPSLTVINLSRKNIFCSHHTRSVNNCLCSHLFVDTFVHDCKPYYE